MKNLALAILILGFFVPMVSHADVATTTPQNGDPMAVTQPWGLTGHETPVFGAGQSVTDRGGVTDTCPWFIRWGCFDITRTSYYENRMTQNAQELVALGVADKFPSLSGWINLVR